MSIRTKCLVMLVCGSGYGYSLAAAAAPLPGPGTCVHIPEDPAPGPGAVSACETDTSYVLDVAGKHYDYPKDAFRDQLRTVLAEWARQSQVNLPQDAWIDFWLAVPEASPQGTMGRAVVTWKGGGLIAYLSVAVEGWELTSRNVGVLEAGESYPQSFGHQAETLLVKVAGTGNLDDVHSFMQAHGATSPSSLSRGWEVYRVPALAENDTAASIKSAPEFSRHVEHLELNAMVEWIALRQRVFAFSFARP